MSDNLSQQTSYWNGRFWPAINTIYSKLYNVTPIDVPYSNIGRVSSYFLETRWAYRELIVPRRAANIWEEDDFFITDVKIIYDDECDKTTWGCYCSYTNKWKTKRKIIKYDYANWQVDWNNPSRTLEMPTNACNNDKLNSINYVKNRLPIPYNLHFYEENTTKDWVVVEWYLWLEEFDNQTWFDIELSDWTEKHISDFNEWITYSHLSLWSYVFVNSSENWENDWACWQVRQILSVEESWRKLLLSSPRLWMKEIEEHEYSRKWYNIDISLWKDWGETLFVADATWLKLLYEWYDWDDDRYIWWLTICDYWYSIWVERYVVDTDVWDNRPVILYSNWYIVYWDEWYNKFFFTTDNANYVGKEKIGIASWKSVLLIFGKRNIDVWVFWENWHIIIYTQTNNVWLHNKHCYWEYEWSMCFISSELKPRLLAIKIVQKTWNYMLEYEDIGGYIQKDLNMIRDDDIVRIDTMDNELRIFIQTKTVINNYLNDCTRIYLYNKRFQVWYEHFTYSIINGCFKNFFYGSWIIVYTKYLDSWDIPTEDLYYAKRYNSEDPFGLAQERPLIESSIEWYINENEYSNWQQAADWGNLDLFRCIKPKSMNILLWYGRYSKNTKIHIVNYKFWFGSELVIDGLYKNKWVENISHIANWDKPEIDECMDADLSDDRTYLESCENSTTLSDVEDQPYVWQSSNGYEQANNRIRLNDNWICVDWWRYNYSWVYPIYINFNETQSPSELVKIEITTEAWDSIAFGWAIVELEVMPYDYKGADWEYTIPFDEDCPKRWIRKPKNCFSS